MIDSPVFEDDRDEDLVVVLHEVVHAGVGDRACVTREVGDAHARHLEVAHLTIDRRDHRRGVDLERGGNEVAVEDVVEVLVGRDAGHDRLPGWIAEQLARVAVRDAGRDLLERDVHDAVRDARWRGHDAGGHLHHARALERAQID